MAVNRGKAFESKFKQDFQMMDQVSIDRIYDSVSGFRGIKNICDFICYKYPFIFYLECKSILGNTFPLGNLTQYDKLLEKKNKKGVNAGVIIWFIDKQSIVYISIEEFERIKNSGYKSINFNKMINNPDFNIVLIPGKVKRTYVSGDYSILLKIAEEKLNENG